MRILIFVILSLSFFLPGLQTNAQPSQDAKKILVEQFSNTRCGICANRIPILRQNMADFNDHIVLLSFFTAAPYSNCVLYQANTEDSDSRVGFYNVLGSPSVYVNGSRVNSGPGIVPSDYFAERLDDEAKVLISADYFNGNDPITVSYEFSEAIEDETLRLHVYIIESYVQAGTISSYQDHFNVMRKAITPQDGELIEAGQIGQLHTWTMQDYTLDPAWNKDSLKIVAFIQGETSQDVYNVAISDEASTTSTIAPPLYMNFSIAPNPAVDFIQVTADNEGCSDCRITIRNISGQIIRSYPSELWKRTPIDVSFLKSGSYIVTLSNGQNTTSKIIVLQK